MTIERVYSAGWGVGEKLTSAQQNSLDINTTYAVDGRTGGYTGLVGSNLAFAGTYTGGKFNGMTLASSVLFGVTMMSSALGSCTMASSQLVGCTMMDGNVGVASGLAQLDGSALLKASQRTGWLVSEQSVSRSAHLTLAGVFSVASGWDVPLVTISGDRLSIDLDAVCAHEGGAGVSSSIGVVVVDSGTVFHPVGNILNVVGVGQPTFIQKHRSLSYICTNTGTGLVRLYASSDSTLTIRGIPTTADATVMRVQQWRP